MRSFPFTTRSKRARKERQRKGRKKKQKKRRSTRAEVQKKKGGGTITEERRITSKVSFYKCKYSVISSFNRCTAQLCVATLSYA